MRKNIKNIFFDLDGTLLPMDQDQFTKVYFSYLAKWMAPHGYEAKTLIDAIWTGTKAMVTNDGSMTNEERFWVVFDQLYNNESRKDYELFNQFYIQHFVNAKSTCGYNPKAAENVSRLKEKGYPVVLATNPIFPMVATAQRIAWAGLNQEDFALVTTYENSHYCKPNPKYYTEICEILGLVPEECVMIGNDASEDLAAEKCGMEVFLLTDDLIDTKGVLTKRDIPHGSYDALWEWLDL